MKIFHSLFFRAMCGLVSGVLLLMYKDDMYQWVTMVLGAVFFLAGVASCILYLADRKRASKAKAEAEKVENSNKNSEKDLFSSQKEASYSQKDASNVSSLVCIVGIASIIFGVMLAATPQTFMPWLSYIFAALLGLGSLLLLFNLAMSLRTHRVHWTLWIAPLLLFLCAVLIIAVPEKLEQKDTILGTALVLYGLTEVINGLFLSRATKTVIADDTLQSEESTGADL